MWFASTNNNKRTINFNKFYFLEFVVLFSSLLDRQRPYSPSLSHLLDMISAFFIALKKTKRFSLCSLYLGVFSSIWVHWQWAFSIFLESSARRQSNCRYRRERKNFAFYVVFFNVPLSFSFSLSHSLGAIVLAIQLHYITQCKLGLLFSSEGKNVLNYGKNKM